MPSSAECGYTQSVCGHTGAGLRQAPRMRIAHVRMWAVAREYTIPQTIQMANRRVVGSRPHQISSPGSRDLRDLGQWDHDTSRLLISLCEGMGSTSTHSIPVSVVWPFVRGYAHYGLPRVGAMRWSGDMD